jgi:hypothetical protein
LTKPRPRGKLYPTLLLVVYLSFAFWRNEMAELIERFCVVCGLGSHRTDWATKTPACDNHSQAEVAAALKAAKPAPTPISQTPGNGPAGVQAAGTQAAPPVAQPPKV